MLKFKIKSKKIDEIKDDELEHIKDIVSGDQFPNIFGDKQRIIVNMKEFIAGDIKNAFKENEINEKIVDELVVGLQRLVTRLSTDNYKYSIDFNKALLNRDIKRVIPKGPKAGETEVKRQVFKLSNLSDAVLEALSKNVSDETKQNLERLFPEIKENSFLSDRSDIATDMAVRLRSIARHEADRIRTEEPSLYKAYSGGITDSRTLIQDVFGIISTMSGENVIVVSRAPADLIRMSDFPGDSKRRTGIVSCHSPSRMEKDEYGRDVPTGEFFECAIFESKSNGAVAYLVPKKAVEEYQDKLQDREFFKDIERVATTGAYPIQRLRLRRYLHIPTETELLVPEKEVYGQHGAETLTRSVLEWARTAQTSEIQTVGASKSLQGSDFAFIGGSYFDTSSEKLLETFLQRYITTSSSVSGVSEKTLETDDKKFIDSLGYRAADAARLGVFSARRVSVPGSDKIIRWITLRSKEQRMSTPLYHKLEDITATLNTDNKTYIENVIKSYIGQMINPHDIQTLEVQFSRYMVSAFSVDLEYDYIMPASGKIRTQDVKTHKSLLTLIEMFGFSNSLLDVVSKKVIADEAELIKQKQENNIDLREIRNRNLKLIKFRG
jgi:hypothetical protein